MEVEIPSKYHVVRRNQEKLPLAAESSYRDHGTIAGGRECRNDDTLPNGRVTQVPKSTKESPNDREPMSLMRKLVFVMSFNVWILYFATFLWVVPCHSDSCKERKDWIFVLPEAELSTNLEAQRSDVGDLVMFGYRNYTALDDVKGTIIALRASNGTPLWTELLSFVPSTLLHTTLSWEGNRTNDGRLLAMGKTGMAVVNISQGNVLWSQTFHSESLIPTIRPVVLRCSSDEFRLLYVREKIREAFIGVLDFVTGRRMVTFRLPCSDSLRTGLHVITSSGQSQAFVVCGFRRAAGIWAVSNEKICDPQEDTETFTEAPYAGTFNIGDIELLGRDLTTLSDGTNLVVLGWRSTLATISVGSEPFSLKWRKSFDDLRIRSFVIGHFSSEGERQIAVAFEGEFSGARVDVLKLSNGEKIASAFVPSSSVKSLKAIARDLNGKIESVLVETVSPEERSLKIEPTASLTNESFFLVTFGKTVTVNELLTTETNNGRRLASDLAGSDDLRLVTAETAANESLKIVGRPLTLSSLCTS